MKKQPPIGGRRVRHRLHGWLGTAISVSADGLYVNVLPDGGHACRCRRDNLMFASSKAIPETRQLRARRKRDYDRKISQFERQLTKTA